MTRDRSTGGLLLLLFAAAAASTCNFQIQLTTGGQRVCIGDAGIGVSDVGAVAGGGGI